MMHRIANFRIERLKRLKAVEIKVRNSNAKYDARAGQTIVGNLGRAGNGQFTRAGGSGGGSVLDKFRGPTKVSKPKKGPKGKKPDAAQADQERIAAGAGVNANDLKALQSFQAGGDMDSATAARLATAGLVDIGSDSKPRLSPNVNTALNALKKGDARAASDALSKSRDRKGKLNAADQKKATVAQEREKRKAEVAARRTAAAQARADKKRASDEERQRKASERAGSTNARDAARSKTTATKIGNRVEEINKQVDDIEAAGSWDSKQAERTRMGNRLEESANEVDGLNLPDADKAKLKTEIGKAMDRIEWGVGDGETRADRAAKELRTVGGVTVYKEADGSYTWATYSSNAFEDRDKEIVSTESLAGAVARMDAQKEYGVLRWWHSGDVKFREIGKWDSACAGEGIDIGQCYFSGLHGRTLIEVGKFKDSVIDGTAYTAKEIGRAFAVLAPHLQVSIGFTHPHDEPIRGVYKHINIFERSFLPKGKAANNLTGVVILKEVKMQKKITGFKLAALKTALSGNTNEVDRVLEFLNGAEAVEKAADEQGARYKAKAEPVLDDEVLATFKTALGDGDMYDAAVAAAVAKLKEDGADDAEAEEIDAKADDTASEDEAAGEEAAAGDFVGDMTIDDYKAMLSEVLAPIADAIGQLAGVAEMQAKAIGQDQATQKELRGLANVVAKLNGDAPTGRAKAYRPSQAKDTETDAPDVKAKQTERQTVSTANVGPLGSFVQRSLVDHGNNGVAHKAKPDDDDDDEDDADENEE